MATWTAQTTTAGHPDQVLMVLTDPDEIARWAPISFEIVDFDGQRLIAVTRSAWRRRADRWFSSR